MSSQNYLAKYLVSTTLFLASVAAFNYVVDPYDLFGSERRQGFNVLKPAASTRVRVIKPYQVSRAAYNTVIIGNSRPELGLNPDSQCWPEKLKPVYNFAVPGAGLYSQYLYATHALNLSGAKTILIGIDFADFIVTPADSASPWPPEKQQFEGRLSIDDPLRPNSLFTVFRDYANSSLSLTALTDSIRTVLSQKNDLSASRTSAGFNPGRDFIAIIHGEGQHSLFRQKIDETNKRFSRPALSLRHPQGESTATRAFRALLEFAQSRDSRVIVFINPYHDDYLAAIEDAGYQSLFQSWKKEMAEQVSEFPGASLIDFSVHSAASAEPSPDSGDKKSILKWYWEPGHYRAQLGDQMLGVIFGNSACVDSSLGPISKTLVHP